MSQPPREKINKSPIRNYDNNQDKNKDRDRKEEIVEEIQENIITEELIEQIELIPKEALKEIPKESPTLVNAGIDLNKNKTTQIVNSLRDNFANNSNKKDPRNMTREELDEYLRQPKRSLTQISPIVSSSDNYETNLKQSLEISKQLTKSYAPPINIEKIQNLQLQLSDERTNPTEYRRNFQRDISILGLNFNYSNKSLVSNIPHNHLFNNNIDINMLSTPTRPSPTNNEINSNREINDNYYNPTSSHPVSISFPKPNIKPINIDYKPYSNDYNEEDFKPFPKNSKNKTFEDLKNITSVELKTQNRAQQKSVDLKSFEFIEKFPSRL